MRDGVNRIARTHPFPLVSNGAAAHVDVRVRSHGDDAWRREHIECTVWSAELHGVAETLDAVVHRALMLARL